MSLAAGTRVGAYEIVAPIGAGGMGVVYRARDPALDRDVAIKFLPEGLTADRDRLARFEREARLLAQLNHPNIAHIYGLVVDGETRALVMELVEGPTLAERLSGGSLPLEECISIARQIADGLDEAHDHGIVHRDLKPQNVKGVIGGRVKILDFGLAKTADDADRSSVRATHRPGSTPTITAPEIVTMGMVLGTAAYMSPEQARGAAPDRRVDVWSFGAILYEMLTGVRLFAAATLVDTLSAVLHQPIDFALLPATTPSRVRELVERCLQRDVKHRLRDLGEARFLLDDSTAGHTVARRDRAEERSAMPSVAVLPFVNLSANQEDELFADGLTEDVIAHLAKVRSLRVISRTSAMAFKGREKSLREIGTILGAGTLLEGSVRRAGTRVRIVAQLIDRDTDEHIWAETYDRDLTDIFAIQTDVALKIAAALQTELSPDEQRRIARYPTRDLEAYQLYVQGRQYFIHFTSEGSRRSLDALQQAIQRDPRFALAYTALAHAYVSLILEGIVGFEPEPSFKAARDAVTRALAIDDTLGEAHGIVGLLRFTWDFNWAGGEQAIRRGLELSPGSADLHDHLGWLYGALGRQDEALDAVRRARELDPITHRSDVATTLMRAGRYVEALEDVTRLIAIEPGFSRAHSISGWAHLFLGDRDRGLAELERAASLNPSSTMFLAQLGQARAMTGDAARAREVLVELERLAAEAYVSPYHFAYVYTGLGEHDTAMDWLERAHRERAGAIYGIKGSFLFTPLREHPRFKALLGQMNLS